MNLLKRANNSFLMFIVNHLTLKTHMFRFKNACLNACYGISIGKGTKIVTPICLNNLCLLKIGDNCWIGHDFSVEGNGEVIIGSNCDISPSVTVLTGSHKVGQPKRRAGEGYNGSVKIEDGCWIGAKSLILPNITIHSSTIVAASSVITKDIPSNKLVAGIPAVVIKVLT